MILNERDERREYILSAARSMMAAARTAPKGKGIDIIEVAVIDREEIEALSAKMVELAGELGLKFFLRDAENILSAEWLLLLGTAEQCLGLNCGYCGYERCADRKPGVPCALNSIDLGIAIGSACATALDMKVDTRVMFSAGYAAECMGHLGKGVKQVIAIPLSTTSKNPFFDRKPKTDK